MFSGHGCYLVISGFHVNNQTLTIYANCVGYLFVCAITILSSLLKRGRISKKRGGVSLPLLPEGILPHPAQFSPSSVYSQSSPYVTTFTCLSFCFNLYVLDKKKLRHGKKILIEEQSPCNHKNPSAGQPMAVHGRTNKNQMGAMLLAFNSSPKSFQLLP